MSGHDSATRAVDVDGDGDVNGDVNGAASPSPST
jgi:hypothetical protein